MKNKAGEYISIVKKRLPEKRFAHTLRVLDTALKLAERYGVSLEKTEVASIFHDFGRSLAKNDLLVVAEENGYFLNEVEKHEPLLLHAPLGAIMVQKEIGLNDPDIVEAIAYHTTGRPGLGRLGKIIYLADAIEPFRDYPGVEMIREVAEEDLDKGFLLALESTIRHLLDTGALIHPLSIETRNSLIIDLKNKK